MVILTKKRYRRNQAIELSIAGSGLALGAAGLIVGSCAMSTANKTKAVSEKVAAENDINITTMRKRVNECSQAIREIQKGLHDQYGWQYNE